MKEEDWKREYETEEELEVPPIIEEKEEQVDDLEQQIKMTFDFGDF